MGNLPRNYILKKGERDFPVVYAVPKIDLPKWLTFPATEELESIFKTKNYKLQTWGRSKDKKGKTILENDAHWIAVKGTTPMHNDPKYPRFSHHLKLRVDGDVYVRGIGKQKLQLQRGTYYVLDTHSPHQVVAASSDLWNVAISVDSNFVLNPKETVKKCLMFAANSGQLQK